MKFLNKIKIVKVAIFTASIFTIHTGILSAAAEPFDKKEQAPVKSLESIKNEIRIFLTCIDEHKTGKMDPFAEVPSFLYEHLNKLQALEKEQRPMVTEVEHIEAMINGVTAIVGKMVLDGKAIHADLFQQYENIIKEQSKFTSSRDTEFQYTPGIFYKLLGTMNSHERIRWIETEITKICRIAGKNLLEKRHPSKLMFDCYNELYEIYNQQMQAILSASYNQNQTFHPYQFIQYYPQFAASTSNTITQALENVLHIPKSIFGKLTPIATSFPVGKTKKSEKEKRCFADIPGIGKHVKILQRSELLLQDEQQILEAEERRLKQEELDLEEEERQLSLEEKALEKAERQLKKEKEKAEKAKIAEEKHRAEAEAKEKAALEKKARKEKEATERKKKEEQLKAEKIEAEKKHAAEEAQAREAKKAAKKLEEERKRKAAEDKAAEKKLKKEAAIKAKAEAEKIKQEEAAKRKQAEAELKLKKTAPTPVLVTTPAPTPKKEKAPKPATPKKSKADKKKPKVEEKKPKNMGPEIDAELKASADMAVQIFDHYLFDGLLEITPGAITSAVKSIEACYNLVIQLVDGKQVAAAARYYIAAKFVYHQLKKNNCQEIGAISTELITQVDTSLTNQVPQQIDKKTKPTENMIFALSALFYGSTIESKDCIIYPELFVVLINAYISKIDKSHCVGICEKTCDNKCYIPLAMGLYAVTLGEYKVFKKCPVSAANSIEPISTAIRILYPLQSKLFKFKSGEFFAIAINKPKIKEDGVQSLIELTKEIGNQNLNSTVIAKNVCISAAGFLGIYVEANEEMPIKVKTAVKKSKTKYIDIATKAGHKGAIKFLAELGAEQEMEFQREQKAHNSVLLREVFDKISCTPIRLDFKGSTNRKKINRVQFAQNTNFMRDMVFAPSATIEDLQELTRRVIENIKIYQEVNTPERMQELISLHKDFMRYCCLAHSYDPSKALAALDQTTEQTHAPIAPKPALPQQFKQEMVTETTEYFLQNPSLEESPGRKRLMELIGQSVQLQINTALAIIQGNSTNVADWQKLKAVVEEILSLHEYFQASDKLNAEHYIDLLEQCNKQINNCSNPT